MKRNISLDKEKLNFICDDDGSGGRRKWFFDQDGQRFVCLNQDERKFHYNIPIDELPSMEDFIDRKIKSLVRMGISEYINNDKLRAMAAPKSQSLAKLMKYKKNMKRQ